MKTSQFKDYSELPLFLNSEIIAKVQGISPASSYFDTHGMKWKGNNLYTILPIHSAVGTFHQRQLRKLELDMARSRLAAQTAM